MTEENATGETVKSDDSISKNWVEFYSNKKEGANTFKIDQRIINNIRTWIKPDTKFTQPFAGVFQGTTRNQMDTIVVMNIKKGKKVSKPLEIKTTDNLPLSGRGISINYNNGNFRISAKAFDINNSNFRIFGDLNHKIESFRNNGMATDNLTYKRMEFFTEATKIAQIMARQMFHLEKFLTPENKNTFGFKIDRDFLRLLTSLETMHPHTVAVELYNVVNNLVGSVRQLQLLFWGLGEQEGSQVRSQLNELLEGVVEFRNALHIAGMTPVSSDGKTKFPSGEPDAPVEEAIAFRLLLEQNRIAKTIYTNPEINIGILRFLNFKDPMLKTDDPNFNHLEGWARSLTRNCFHLLSSSVSTTMTESEVKIDNELLLNLLQSELEHSSIKVKNYEESRSRIEHLAKSISEDKAMRIPEIKQIFDEINTATEVLSKPIFSHLPALVNCLRTNPDQINNRIRRQEQIHDVTLTWTNDIKALEIDILMSEPEKEDQLLSIAKKYGIEPQHMHKSLVDTAKLADDSRKKFNEVMNNTRTSNSVTKDAMITTRNNLKELQKELEKEYIKLRDKLLEGLAKDATASGRELTNFSQNVNNSLTEFQDGINDLDAGELAKHSDAPSALMIGLGQGGEWIVRATLAKLLNNNSDTRCRNLLKGLNINLKEVQNQYKDLPHGFDSAVPRSDQGNGTSKAFTQIFDDANLLAINAGPEQKTMLEQPYNYIWGSRSGKNIKNNQRKDKYIRQSTNAFLIDISKEGSGGKMGRGRAYSAAAENAIGDTLREKKRGKNIRQVCIVHSFAGGSGSGMILPVLRMVKQSMPGATVWVFSAGETDQGNSTHDAENVVYITSDILQARYNALHFKEKEITLKEWKTYKQKASKLYKELNDTWEKIAPHLTSDKILDEEDYRNSKINDMDNLNSQLKNYSNDLEGKFVINNDSFSKAFDSMNEMVSDTEKAFTESVHEWVVSNALEQQKFYQTVSDPSSANAARMIWKTYFNLLQDKGSFALNPENFDQEMVDNPESDNVSFNTQYAHLRYIIRGLELVKEQKDPRKAITSIETQKQTEGQRNYMLVGAEAQIDYQKVDPTFDLSDLMQLIRTYSTSMRKYHNLLMDFYEEIKLSLGATDDPLVKHVIVSNAHLDVAAKKIAPKRSKKYEIYNSIVVDTFVNLVHSLVENNDDEEHTKIVNSTALNNEVMDLNDMRGRTHPTSNATILSFPELMTASTDFMYNETDRDIINNDWAYEVMKMIFQDIKSPFVNKGLWGTTKFETPGRVLRALYNNYLRDKNGLRRYKIWEVIESVDRSMVEDLLVPDNVLNGFWENVESRWDNELESKKHESQFGKDELENSINWLKFLGPKHVSCVFETEKDREEFRTITSEWEEIHTAIFTNEDRKSPFNPGYRETTISNLLKDFTDDMDANNRETMKQLLFNLGIIDASHLAAIPCSLVYDYAPGILFENTEYSVHVHDGSGQSIVEVDDDDWESYLPRTQLPATDIQSSIVNHAWGDVIDEYRDAGYTEEDLQGMKLILQEKGSSSEGRYISIRSDFTSADAINHIQITPDFMRDFAGIKNKVSDAYPEFSNNTVLNKLISVSPNIRSGSKKRKLEEKPEFRTAESDLEVNSIPKKLHDGETKSSMIFRTILIGNSERNSRLEALYNTNLKESKAEWFFDVQSINQQAYGKIFNPKTFDSNLEKRLNKLKEIANFDGLEDLPVVDAMMKFIRNSLVQIEQSNDESEGTISFNSREYFDDLFRIIETKEAEFISNHEESLNRADLENHTSDLKNLVSRLTSLCFSAHRQYKFQTDSSSKEYGVAFEFNGTLDASRSLPNDWLWLVNSSETVIASQVERTINYYHSNYLLNTDRIKMKVFIQNIQNGPLCNMTLVSQKSGVTEISEKYSDLMRMLSKDKFAVVKGPLMHPYSFVRNILWLHTFDYTWVKDPTPAFTQSLEIPDDVIRGIFGNPDLIDESENTMSQSGDMSGIDWSKYDVQMWQRAKRHVWNEINIEDRENYKQRMKFPVHVPDMILINYLKEYALENNKDFNDVFNRPPEEVTDVYPVNFWRLRLLDLGVSSGMILRKNKTQVKVKKKIKIKPKEGTGKPDEKGTKSGVWLTALNSWKQFLEPSNPKD